MSPLILGLDISKSRTGVAVLNANNNQLLYYQCFSPTTNNIKDVALEYSFLIDILFERYNISKVIIEDTFMMTKNSSIKDLSMVHGAMLVNILMRNVDILKIPTMSCKKFHNCSVPLKDENKKIIKTAKELLFEKIVKEYQLENFNFVEHNDITDAIALAACHSYDNLIKKTIVNKKTKVKKTTYLKSLREY